MLWFGRAATVGGLAAAHFALGLCLSTDDGIPPDDEAALQHFTAAASKLHHGAEYELAMFLSAGRAVSAPDPVHPATPQHPLHSLAPRGDWGVVNQRVRSCCRAGARSCAVGAVSGRWEWAGGCRARPVLQGAPPKPQINILTSSLGELVCWL